MQIGIDRYVKTSWLGHNDKCDFRTFPDLRVWILWRRCPIVVFLRAGSRVTCSPPEERKLLARAYIIACIYAPRLCESMMRFYWQRIVFFFLRFFWLMVLNRLTAERNVNITDILCAKVKIINCVKIRNLNFFLKIIVGNSR